ncbi:cytochrome P450 [Colletotrichum spaethianum]|uniref:Cytochrome P450 n=1 Tax=Colletotrichum spaethianum TaxID=700344 RepID=A0AA37NXR9_9PEZI|nr:cytochrome P450 [Colletotrichum spaethianum]GKT42665.1 cytochrome P450 [Colletotrichum spaethianum]
MAREYLYLTSSAVLGSYILWTAAETYLRWSHGSHLTSSDTRAYAHPVLAALLVIPALILYNKASYLFKMRARNCGEVPVYPHMDPIFGSDWVRASLARQRDHGLLEWWQTVFDKLGHTWWFKTPTAWMLMTSEPENLKAILASSFEDFPITGPRREAVLPILGPDAIFVANGEGWHGARAMMRPTFVRNQIADLKCFERHVGDLIGRIPKDGGTVDLQALLYMMTMDSATDFMHDDLLVGCTDQDDRFGHSTDMLTTPSLEAREFTSTFEYITTRSAIRSRLGLLTFFGNDKKWEDGLKTINRFCDTYVERVRADLEANEKKANKEDPERGYVFLNEMMAQPGMTPAYVRAQLLSMILAGRDTTASTLSALFWILARRGDVVKRLRDEVEGLQGRKPTWEEMKDMKYLNMVLKEILRLYPTVSTMSRGTARDTTLPVGGGPDGKSPIFVPKGTTVRWSTFRVHRRKDLYGEDADEFRPERWEERRPSWDYIPFSGGPRICIGQQFALTQMSYFVVRILQTFKEISPRDDRPLQQIVGITTKLPNDVLLSFTPA